MLEDKINTDLGKNLSNQAKELRARKTSKRIIKTRPGGGDKLFSYVEIIHYERWLDENYPLWEFEIIPSSFQEFRGFIQLACKLTVTEQSIESKRSIIEIGMDEIKYNRTTKEPLKLMYAKTAASDGLKRCVRRLGGFADLYGYDEEEVVLNEEDINWFVFEFIPLYIASLKEGKIKNAKNIFQVIFKFYSGEYTKEFLLSKLN